MAWRMMLLLPLLIKRTTLLPFTHLATMLLLHTLACRFIPSASQSLWLLLWLLQMALWSLWLLLQLVSIFPGDCRLSLLGCQETPSPLVLAAVSPWRTRAQPIVCSPTRWPSFCTRLFPTYKFGWVTIHIFQFLVVAWPLFSSMVSKSSLDTSYMCWILQSLSTAFACTSSNTVAVLWGPMKQRCWCISLGLFSWWIRHWTATFSMSLSDGPPNWTPSTMCSHGVLHCCTLLNSLLHHAWSPRIQPSSRMTLLLMGQWWMFLLRLRRNPVLLWFLLPTFFYCQRMLRLSYFLTHHHSTCLPCPLTFVCLWIRSILLPVFWSLPTLPLHVTRCRCSSPPSLMTKSSNSSIIPIPLFQLFVHVTLQTSQTLRHIGLQRKFIGLWVVKKIEMTSYRSVGMVHGSTVVISPPLLVPLLLSLRQNAVNHLTTPVTTSIWMLFMWISLLVTVMPLVVFNMPLFWWTGPPSTTGHLVFKCCCPTVFVRRSIYFGLPLALLQGVSIVTAKAQYLHKNTSRGPGFKPRMLRLWVLRSLACELKELVLTTSS
jgi:hypothetical protein